MHTERKVFIPAGMDRRFRTALLASLIKAGPKAAWHIRNALIEGPARGGALESMQYFGKELQEKLVLTAPIIDGLEISVPGFKKWLEATGFANDKSMIKGFVAWAEYTTGTKNRIIMEADKAFHVQ